MRRAISDEEAPELRDGDVAEAGKHYRLTLPVGAQMYLDSENRVRIEPGSGTLATMVPPERKGRSPIQDLLK